MAPVAFPIGVCNADIAAIILVGRNEFAANGFNHLFHTGFLAAPCSIFWSRSGNPSRAVMNYVIGAGHFFGAYALNFTSLAAWSWTRMNGGMAWTGIGEKLAV